MGDEVTVVRQLQRSPQASTSSLELAVQLCIVQQELEQLFRSEESELTVFILGLSCILRDESNQMRGSFQDFEISSMQRRCQV